MYVLSKVMAISSKLYCTWLSSSSLATANLMCRGVIRPFLLSLAALPASSKISAKHNEDKKNIRCIYIHLSIYPATKCTVYAVEKSLRTPVKIAGLCDVKKIKTKIFHLSCDIATNKNLIKMKCFKVKGKRKNLYK